MRGSWWVLVVVASAVGTACGDCSQSGPGTGGADGGGALDLGTDGGGGSSDDGGGGDGDGGGGVPDMGTSDIGDVDANSCQVTCGDSCCGDGEECVDDACLPQCAGVRCADDALCCEGAEVCIFNACIVPGADCRFPEDCGIDEFCEPTLGKCVPRDQADICEFRPPVGEFEPSIGCSWPGNTPLDVNSNSYQVVVAPIVGNLTDDNGDGVTNQDDIPEIVFHSRTPGCCNKQGTLRIVHGECLPDGEMRTIASLDSVVMANDSAPALGDLDGDGVAELVAVKGQNLQPNGKVTPQGLVAWKRVTDDGSSWTPLWENDTYPTWNVHTRGGATVSIADLNGDGNPEVVVGNVAINGQDGTLLWDGVETSQGLGGIGNNAFLGPSSSVGDVDLDGNQEVAAGNTLYDHDGTVLWTFEYTSDNSPCGGNLPCDGFTAMANFDADPEGEIVIIRRGEAFVLNHDGSLLWQQPIIKDDCNNNESGPPTVADFDGDGRPEIGTAAADFYTVMDMDCDVDDWMAQGCRERGVLWATPNNDCSSRVTASSVFDFEGDGKAEMVYADEQNFRIFDGTTGAVLFDDPSHSSNTRIEMPVVADVDNDGNSEVVIPSATADGIKVWQDASDNWVRTRRIWNQHAYSVTNVNEDGTIPAVPQVNWANPRLNNFRQNVQPDGLLLAPNLVVESVDVQGLGCGDNFEVSIRVTISNDGSLGIPAGVPVRVVGANGGDVVVIADVATTRRLLPGEDESFDLTYTVPADWVQAGFTIDAIVDPDMTVNECLEDDNELRIDGSTVNFAAPQLVFDGFDADVATCGQNREVDVTLTVKNDGTATVPANVPLVVTAQWAGQPNEITTFRTSAPLSAGATESFTYTWMAPVPAVGRMIEFVATVDPNREVYDCDDQEMVSVTKECRPPM